MNFFKNLQSGLKPGLVTVTDSELTNVGQSISSLNTLKKNIESIKISDGDITAQSLSYLPMSRDYLQNAYQELVIIIDKSASCNGLEEPTIEALNKLLQDERQKEYNTIVTLILFGNICDKEVIFFRKPIDQVTNISYCANSNSTYLYDTLGETITCIRDSQTRDKLSNKKIGNTFVAIMTDGENNNIKNYTLNSVRSLIYETQNMGWKYFFIGAIKNAKEIAASLGINDCDASVIAHSSSGIAAGMNFIQAGINKAQLPPGKTLRLTRGAK